MVLFMSQTYYFFQNELYPDTDGNVATRCTQINL